MEFIKTSIYCLFSNYLINFFNGCLCSDQCIYFAAICQNCLYNALIHSRNYFQATNCFSVVEGKIIFCYYCLYLKNLSNKHILKVSFLETDLGKCNFEALLLQNYLYQKIKASSFFIFYEGEQIVHIYIANPIYGNLMFDKGTHQLNVFS